MKSNTYLIIVLSITYLIYHLDNYTYFKLLKYKLLYFLLKSNELNNKQAF